MANLTGKVALVTGAGQGVGQGIALALAAAGATVAVTGRTESKLTDTLKTLTGRGGKGLAIVCDVFKAGGHHAHRGAHRGGPGGIDILVNNAYEAPSGRCCPWTTRRSCAASMQVRWPRSASCAPATRT